MKDIEKLKQGIQEFVFYIEKSSMRLFDKLFGKKAKVKEKREADSPDQAGKFMPKPDIPIDEKFIINFNENGGKFLYCVDDKDVKSNFYNILKENNWNEEVCCFDENLKEVFQEFDLKFTTNFNADFCLLPCEFLIADSGSLLMTSNQIGERKLADLPYNFVVLAYTSQLIATPDDGLRIINYRKQNLPTNISSIKNFKEEATEEGHFMSYGSVSKNLYLLLLEDL